MAAYTCLKQQSFQDGAYSLVPLRYEDRFDIMQWRNEQIYHLRQTRLLTREDQQRYFDEVVSQLFAREHPDQVLFSYLEDGRCIGYGGLVHINWTDRNAEISFLMDTRLEKEGFATHWSHYLPLIKEVAFEQLQLHKIYTYAFDLRPHLYPVLENNGFTREATLKEHCCFEGSYKDVVIHSLVKEDYYTIRDYTACTPAQLLEILALRNRDDVRCWMVHPEIIPEVDHFRFVERLKGDPDRVYYAVYQDGTLVGTYDLIRIGGDCWERGLIAAPSTRGTGRTAQWEREILTRAALPPMGVKTVMAKVKPDNVRANRYHLKLGFREQSRDESFVYYILTLS